MAASVAGRAHVARGQENEDALRIAYLPNGALVLALADGAGSANHASEGASLAVEAAVGALREALANFPAATVDLPLVGVRAEEEQGSAAAPTGDRERGELSEVLQEALTAVRSAVAERVRESRIQVRVRPREFSSTLLLAVLQGDTLAVLQLGDGAVVTGDRGGWQRVTQPLRGHHAGETLFATSRGASRHAHVEVLSLGDSEAVALLSDGLEPIATDMASGEPHAPFFEPLLKFAGSRRPLEELETDLEEFLGSERVQSRSPDDLSLIIAVRQPGL